MHEDNVLGALAWPGPSPPAQPVPCAVGTTPTDSDDDSRLVRIMNQEHYYHSEETPVCSRASWETDLPPFLPHEPTASRPSRTKGMEYVPEVNMPSLTNAFYVDVRWDYLSSPLTDENAEADNNTNRYTVLSRYKAGF